VLIFIHKYRFLDIGQLYINIYIYYKHNLINIFEKRRGGRKKNNINLLMFNILNKYFFPKIKVNSDNLIKKKKIQYNILLVLSSYIFLSFYFV
jgi:hypothetical protein